MTTILLLQGPNMHFLGRREPEHYGTTTAPELDAQMMRHAGKHGYELQIFYTNSEGSALDRIYQAVDEGVDGLVMNPASFSLAGHSMRFCLQAVKLPYVEVHMRNQYALGIHSTLADLADGVVQGFGVQTYILALDAMLHVLSTRTAASAGT